MSALLYPKRAWFLRPSSYVVLLPRRKSYNQRPLSFAKIPSSLCFASKVCRFDTSRGALGSVLPVPAQNAVYSFLSATHHQQQHSPVANSLDRQQLSSPSHIVIVQGRDRRLTIVDSQIIPGAIIQVMQQLIERQCRLRVAGSQSNRDSRKGIAYTQRIRHGARASGGWTDQNTIIALPCLKGRQRAPGT